MNHIIRYPNGIQIVDGNNQVHLYPKSDLHAVTCGNRLEVYFQKTKMHDFLFSDVTLNASRTIYDATGGSTYASLELLYEAIMDGSYISGPQLGGKSKIVKLNPTISLPATQYTSGDVVGGKLTVSGAITFPAGTAMLQSLLILDKSNQKAALTIIVFDADPSASTFTDNSAPVINAADVSKIIRKVNVAAADYETVGGIAIADLAALSKIVEAASGTTLYIVITTTGTPTYASGALSVNCGY